MKKRVLLVSMILVFVISLGGFSVNNRNVAGERSAKTSTHKLCFVDPQPYFPPQNIEWVPYGLNFPTVPKPHNV